MKKILLSLSLFLGLCNVQAQVTVIGSTSGSERQDTIDMARLLVHYEMEFRTDTTRQEHFSESTLLEVGQRVSKFYSYTKFVCDSVAAADRANRVPSETLIEHVQQFGKPRISEQCFKHYPAGRTTTLDEIGGTTRLRCEEEEERPQWRLLPDTATLLSYPCLRAECHFKGRSWSVYYTPEVPLSEGPWKLQGLPGLILQAEDSTGDYRFTATALRQCHTPHAILYGGHRHESVNRRQYDKLHERFYADPIGFLTQSLPGATITVSDRQGRTTGKPKGMAYNPIEK